MDLAFFHEALLHKFFCVVYVHCLQLADIIALVCLREVCKEVAALHVGGGELIGGILDFFGGRGGIAEDGDVVVPLCGLCL